MKVNATEHRVVSQFALKENAFTRSTSMGENMTLKNKKVAPTTKAEATF
jgi:hypothetical protein